MTRIKGLEALFTANKNIFKQKEDCIVAALHCLLINADLLCVGLGEAFSDDDSGSASELLPENWNESQDVYCLRYRDQDLKQCYLLKIVKAGSNLHVDLAKDEDITSGMTINTDEFVSDSYDKFSETFKALDKLNENFQQNMLSQIQVNSKKSSIYSMKKKSSKKERTPDRKASPIPAKVPIPQVQPIPTGVPDTRRQGPPLSAFPRIGGNDLDPFGRSEGSMLFDPSNMGIPSRMPFGRGGLGSFGGGLPPHAVPPGARFDPFGPPDVGLGGRFNPDPDHFRPPDYDNMFM